MMIPNDCNCCLFFKVILAYGIWIFLNSIGHKKIFGYHFNTWLLVLLRKIQLFKANSLDLHICPYWNNLHKFVNFLNLVRWWRNAKCTHNYISHENKSTRQKHSNNVNVIYSANKTYIIVEQQFWPNYYVILVKNINRSSIPANIWGIWIWHFNIILITFINLQCN